MNDLKLIILCGGNSPEREVSISTGKAIYECLNHLCNVKLIDYENVIESIIPKFKSADLIFNALHGGDGENGNLQSIFENYGIKYTGSNSESSKLAIDKNATKLIAQKQSIPTPNWMMYDCGIEFNEHLAKILELGFPLVVKPADEGSTLGLTIVQNENEIKVALDFALKFSKSVMFEEFIPGRELTVGILGDEYLPIVEIIPSHVLYDFECKYTSGMSNYICPAKLDLEINQNMQNDALKLHQSLGCRHYSRVDYRLNENGEYYMLEINTLPGMTSTSLIPKAAKAKNISFELLLKKIIRLAI